MATYVLVHGTGSGGWLWDPVVDRLREAGHTVHAPTLVGVGERASEGGPDTDLTTHVQQIVSLIQDQAAPRVVLVGFSYSGLVVEGVAAAIPGRIAQLVLIDAMHAPKGKSGFDLLPASAAEQVRTSARIKATAGNSHHSPLKWLAGSDRLSQALPLLTLSGHSWNDVVPTRSEAMRNPLLRMRRRWRVCRAATSSALASRHRCGSDSRHELVNFVTLASQSKTCRPAIFRCEACRTH